ncbi:hypothetical protein ATANTOWER_003716 [Ataeniobius toweri]|uniref:Multiple coagulation factor deficiency 2 n=1 Tax=Ataeniobius toweri TaxID=208326 RepID=A0ABU7A4U8_9TELE|nr:hypothetical protein [Ataeniobius toweri]
MRRGAQWGGLFLFLSWSLLCAHSQVSPHQQQPPPVVGGSAHITRLDRNMVQDKDHIMEHLEGVIDKPEKDMTPQELQLHYFKMHDYDGNNLLDGLELATAITHVHKEVDTACNLQLQTGKKRESFTHLDRINMICYLQGSKVSQI